MRGQGMEPSENHKMNNLCQKLAIGIPVTAVLVLIDRLTKILAVRFLKGREPFSIIDGVFELHYLENAGAAFGTLQNRQIFLMIITCVIFAAILYLYIWRVPRSKRFAPLYVVAILFFAGAIGNFIDRLTQNYVVDFFYFRLIDFPIFNVADIYVTTAAILLIIFLFYYKEEDFEKIFPSRKRREEQ